MANKYKIPRLTSAKTIWWEKGITAHETTLNKNERTGASTKIAKFELLGKVVSLTNSFNPSDNACNKPINPTTLGPLRLWIAPIILRSATVK